MNIIDRMNFRQRATGAHRRALDIWEQTSPVDQQNALETLSGVLNSKLWLKERQAYFETLSDEALIRWRKKTFPTSIQ